MSRFIRWKNRFSLSIPEYSGVYMQVFVKLLFVIDRCWCDARANHCTVHMKRRGRSAWVRMKSINNHMNSGMWQSLAWLPEQRHLLQLWPRYQRKRPLQGNVPRAPSSRRPSHKTRATSHWELHPSLPCYSPWSPAARSHRTPFIERQCRNRSKL